jgi:NADH-quinone oxidoreductase subunit J
VLNKPRETNVTADLVIFIGLAVVAIAAAVSMLVSRNAVYSALFLVINFIAVAVLYLLLEAAFIAMVQVTVYAGAIMVLFLFVIMLLGAENVEVSPSMPWQRPAAIVLGVAVLIQFAYILLVQPFAGLESLAAVPEGFGSPASIGQLLFSEYLIPFEVTSLLLLAAMVGAIVLTRAAIKEREDRMSSQ